MTIPKKRPLSARRPRRSLLHDQAVRLAGRQEGSRRVALTESEAEYRSTFEDAPIGIAHVGLDGRWLRANAHLRLMLGLSAEELQGMDVWAVSHPDEVENTVDALARLLAGEVSRAAAEKRFRRKDGSYARACVTASVGRDAAGAPTSVIAIVEDAERAAELLREQQIRQAHKVDAVGHFAGGIAHDFNNVLTSIIGFAEIMMADLQPGDSKREDLQQILDAGRSGAAMTRQLLAFSRKQVFEPQVLDLNALVRDTQSHLHRVLGEDIALVAALRDGPCRVNADRAQLEQAMMILAVNAREAMPAGGTLRVATETLDQDDAFVASHPGARTGPHVCLTFTDTGVGMGPDVLAHLFEPFFTTKEHGKGTGLGLATVYAIVKQSGGYIRVESAPGAGASFTLSLPCAACEREGMPLPLAGCDATPALTGSREGYPFGSPTNAGK